MNKLLMLALGTCIAGAAFGQDKPNAMQEQANQPRAAASVKLRQASQAHTAAETKDSKLRDAMARKERAEQVAGSVQKKANDTANAAASNVK